MMKRLHPKPKFTLSNWDVEKHNPVRDTALRVLIIRFDGGLSNDNGPYGSYRINNGKVIRVFHDPITVVTSNQAEIQTFICAINDILTVSTLAHKTRLCVYGDSKIALSHIVKAGLGPVARQDSWTDNFWSVVLTLRVKLLPFAQVAVKWQKRDHNVRIFGH